jgi:hypothetical protein
LKAATSFPTADVFGQQSILGTYFPQSPTTIICGACIGFQAASAEKIVNSGLLLNAKYNSAPYAYAERRYGTPRQTVILNDPIMDDVITQLGLTKAVWTNLHLQMSWEPATKIPAGTTFAHPVKE